MKNVYIFVIGIIVLFGCEKATEWDLDVQELDLLVVEAQITNELRSQTVRLSRPMLDPNDDPEPVSGAIVAVIVENRPFFFVELVQGSGFYFSDTLQAVVDRTYQLYININGREYSATTQMEPVTPLKPFSYNLVDEENGLHHCPES